MEIWNINPSHLNINIKEQHNYSYNFLDLLDFNVTPYYSIIKSLYSLDLHKFYKYLYIRSIRLNKLFPKFTIIDPNISINIPDDLNNNLNKYINKDIIRAIFILNSIQLYSHY